MSEWKKVEDELPKNTDKPNDHVWCLVVHENYGILVRPFNQHYQVWDDEDADDYLCDAVDGCITHWMETPEYPKDGE